MLSLDLNRAIRRLVELTTGIAPGLVRAANENVEVPDAGLWATVLVTQLAPRGWDVHSWEEIDASPTLQVEETAEAERLVMASINFYRDGANDAAGRLTSRITLTDAAALMRQRGIGFVSLTPARNLTGVVFGIWEERAQLDVYFHVCTSEETAVDTYGEFPFRLYTETYQVDFTVEE